MNRLLIMAVLLSCSSASAQDAKQYLLATKRSGVIELMDPDSLTTVSRIHVALPPDSVGLNEISASEDGSTIYVEGPITSDPNGCCSLYSIDLATLQIAAAKRVPGISTVVAGKVKAMRNDRMYLSPDGRWLFGVKNFRGPALDMYDLAQGKVVRRLVPSDMEEGWQAGGTWTGGLFYFYVTKVDGSAGRLWALSPGTAELGPGVEIEPFATPSGCSASPFVPQQVVSAGASLFVYERFGFIFDRRTECAGGIVGGAWQIDPSSGRLLRVIAPELHFAVLLGDPGTHVLYGLSNGGPGWESPVQIVEIDPEDGRILQSHTLDADYWTMSLGRLRNAPSGDAYAVQAHTASVK